MKVLTFLGKRKWPRLRDFGKLLITLFIVILILGACSSSKKDQESAKAISSVDSLAARVTLLANEYVRNYIATFPEKVAAFGLPSAANDRLSDNSLAGLSACQAKEDGWGRASSGKSTASFFGGARNG